MKNVKIYTKLMIGFLIIDALVLLGNVTGTLTIDKMVEFVQAGEINRLAGYARSYKVFTALLLAVEIIIAGGISVGVTRTIRKGVEQLTEAANGIAAGKVDVKLEKQNNDEFGELIDNYQKIIDGMRDQVNVASQVAEGNFSLEFPEKSADDELSAILNLLTKRNSDAITEIKESSSQVRTSASQVASASEALAQGSTEQASAIEQITASIEDVAQKTKQNAVEANEATDLVAEAMIDVKKGNEQMREMMVAMKDINNASESISKIIKVIDDIAFQTNILALNAAVEAARAGDAGKGFGVVAEEVRSLAAKSAAAAAETAELIEDSMNKVDAGSKIADETAKALEAITEAVTKSESLVAGIAESSNYQATAIAQIDQAVSQVSQVVQTNSATSEECAVASEELFNQANAVLDLLSVYKLRGDSGNNRRSKVDNRYKRTVEKREPVISFGEGFGKY